MHAVWIISVAGLRRRDAILTRRSRLPWNIATRAELQREAVRALEFKCDVLWSMLDAIHHGYFKEGRSPIRPSAGNFGGRETAAPC